MFIPHRAMSRARLRGTTMHSATGAAAAVLNTTTGCSRRLRAGAASPAATTVQAATRIPQDDRKAGQYRFEAPAPGFAGPDEAPTKRPSS